MSQTFSKDNIRKAFSIFVEPFLNYWHLIAFANISRVHELFLNSWTFLKYIIFPIFHWFFWIRVLLLNSWPFREFANLLRICEIFMNSWTFIKFLKKSFELPDFSVFLNFSERSTIYYSSVNFHQSPNGKNRRTSERLRVVGPAHMSVRISAAFSTIKKAGQRGRRLWPTSIGGHNLLSLFFSNVWTIFQSWWNFLKIDEVFPNLWSSFSKSNFFFQISELCWKIDKKNSKLMPFF